MGTKTEPFGETATVHRWYKPLFLDPNSLQRSALFSGDAQIQSKRPEEQDVTTAASQVCGKPKSRDVACGRSSHWRSAHGSVFFKMNDVLGALRF